jgi:hypothetical protein
MKTRNGSIEKHIADGKSQWRHCELRWRKRDVQVEFVAGIANRGAALKGE